jgi:hypothetical protein
VRTAALLALWLPAAAPAFAQAPEHGAIHLGVASCVGSNCHGAEQRTPGSLVAQNEYLIWSRWDKHHDAYKALAEPRALRIARNLGLPDAIHAELCLNCHTDNVPANRRGPQFHLADGVGCEACHGGASTWLGIHISGASHQANLEAGLYPTENPLKRAEKCFSCHFGDARDEKRFVTHRIMGAGHPRMGFELDTYTMAEPAHFTIDKAYVARKGPVNHAQVWAVGQAYSLLLHSGALLSPRLAPKGLFPELVLFDCESCHHPYDWRRAMPASAGLPTGWPPLYDADAVMLRLIAGQAAPGEQAAVAGGAAALQGATTESWAAVRGAAARLRGRAGALGTAMSSHDFTPQQVRALARGLLALSLGPRGGNFTIAEQAAMGLAALGSQMQLSGALTPPQAKAMTAAIDGLDRAFTADNAYRYGAFVKALHQLQSAVPQ